MNKDRRSALQLCIELIKECAHTGEMSEASHQAIVEAVKLMKNAEYWSLRKQEPHEGKNESTDTGIAISRVALPALESAHTELAKDEPEYNAVVDWLYIAINTDGTKPRTRRRK